MDHTIEKKDKSLSLNTIRALHETVVSLRSALEKSKSEILSLKNNDVLNKENQDLKKHIENLRKLKSNVKRDKIERIINVTHNVSSKKNKKKHVKVDITVELRKKSPKKSIKMEEKSQVEEEVKTNEVTDQLESQMPSVTMTVPPVTQSISENVQLVQKSASVDYLDQELDDIELIFTTDDTKEFKEDSLVSIDAPSRERNRLQRPLSNYEELSGSDRELDDDVFNDNFDNENQENFCRYRIGSDSKYGTRGDGMYDSKSDNSINNPSDMKSLRSCYSYHDSSFENKSLEKDESFDRFEENIHIVETDISKVGIQESSEYISVRRNTCPNPLQYRPIIHREALSKSSRRTRPVLGQSAGSRRESGAQTDISALPNSSVWRSESSLARKIRTSDTPITTLPSKYPLPASQYYPNHNHTQSSRSSHHSGGKYTANTPGIAINISPVATMLSATGQHRRPSANTKTLEARRVLLSDIGFTSMVPELSRSADHLAGCRGVHESVDDKEGEKGVEYGRFLQAGDCCSPGYSSQRFLYSPLDSRYSSATLPPPQPAQLAMPAVCLDTVPHCTTLLRPGPAQFAYRNRRCSAPVSPSRYNTLLSGTTAHPGCPLLQHQSSVGATCGCCGRGMKGRVRFASGHSMPDLRASTSLDCCDSGDSTDSLLEETEQFLRRSIDCIVDGSMGGGGAHGCTNDGGRARTGVRRSSAPEPHRDNVPPLGWHPFLPRQPRDLRPDYWVKVISPEGRVRGGRVRYVGVYDPGPALTTTEKQVMIGVQLSCPDGQCDGEWQGHRYFQCEPDHGLFVPFKKIVMGWKP